LRSSGGSCYTNAKYSCTKDFEIFLRQSNLETFTIVYIIWQDSVHFYWAKMTVICGGTVCQNM